MNSFDESLRHEDQAVGAPAQQPIAVTEEMVKSAVWDLNNLFAKHNIRLTLGWSSEKYLEFLETVSWTVLEAALGES